MTRKLARDMIFKILYQADIQKENYDLIYSINSSEAKIDAASEKYILETLHGVEKNIDSINTIISEKSNSWKIDRISKISLACLKLGIYEILYSDEIPNAVAINESVNLSKLYESEESAKFVNGILSVVLKEKENNA